MDSFSPLLLVLCLLPLTMVNVPVDIDLVMRKFVVNHLDGLKFYCRKTYQCLILSDYSLMIKGTIGVQHTKVRFNLCQILSKI